MEIYASDSHDIGPSLPLSSLRLLVPPLRLMSAWMWQVAEQRNILQYGKLEEFVMLVTETVPELMSFSQRTKLILGLRTRVILELCRMENPLKPQTIKAHLDKLRNFTQHGNDEEGEKDQTVFIELVQAMLKDTARRNDFFQHVFPVEYGPDQDAALQNLIWEFLSRVEELLPAPDLKQTASWVRAAPSALEDFVQPLSEPEELKNLLQHHKHLGQSKKHASPSSMGDIVHSSLPSREREIATQQAAIDAQSETMHAAASIVSSASSYAEDLESLTDSIDYTGMAGIRERDDEINEETTSDERDSPQNREIGQIPQSSRGLAGGVVSESRQKEGEKTPHPPIHQQDIGPVSVPITARISPSPLLVISPVTTRGCHIGNSPASQVSLQQWISQIASKVISFPVLPRPPANDMDKEVCSGDMCLGRSVEVPSVQLEKAIIRRKMIKHTTEDQVESKNTHKPEKSHPCPDCGKHFQYSCLLKDHQRTHTGEKPFQCSDCGKTFRCLGFLTNHLKTHSGGRPFKCDSCAKAFRKHADLVKHIRVHTGEKPYKCTICGKSFTQGSYLKIHRECHTAENLHHCTHCEKSFPTAFKLSIHERYHTMERQYRCNQCEKSFIYASLLRRHKGYHVGERQFLCSLCGKAFVYMFDLKKHQRNHDKPRLEIPCTICHKTFSSNEMLRCHMRVHTGERPYHCEECGKTFSQIGNMKRHQRVHTGERPFICKVCEKTYKHSSHLKEHMLSHTGERPWQCTQCGKSFKFSGPLKKHMRTHSGERAEHRRSFDHPRNRKRHETKRC